MTPTVSQKMTKNKIFMLSQNLTSANYGIYLATYVIFQQLCVGQTVNTFSDVP